MGQNTQYCCKQYRNKTILIADSIGTNPLRDRCPRWKTRSWRSSCNRIRQIRQWYRQSTRNIKYSQSSKDKMSRQTLTYAVGVPKAHILLLPFKVWPSLRSSGKFAWPSWRYFSPAANQYSSLLQDTWYSYEDIWTCCRWLSVGLLLWALKLNVSKQLVKVGTQLQLSRSLYDRYGDDISRFKLALDQDHPFYSIL